MQLGVIDDEHVAVSEAEERARKKQETVKKKRGDRGNACKTLVRISLIQTFATASFVSRRVRW